MTSEQPAGLDVITDIAKVALAVTGQLGRMVDGSGPGTAEMHLTVGGVVYRITIERGGEAHEPEPLMPPI
jgi:hypothetical protein